MKTKDIVITGLLIAVIYISTAFINFPLPFSPDGGLVHLGTVMLFVISVVFGGTKGAFAGSLGMSLFNLTSPWVVWAPFTFVIRFVMGYVIGYISNYKGAKGQSMGLNYLSLGIAALWFFIGSYIAGAIILGDWVIPVTHIPGNVLQIVLAMSLGMPIISLINDRKLN